jgi:hypothetical protein
LDDPKSPIDFENISEDNEDFITLEVSAKQREEDFGFNSDEDNDNDIGFDDTMRRNPDYMSKKK